MAYTKLWDVIQDQLWSFQDANLWLNSIQYLGNMFNLGVSETSGYAPGLTLNNDPTDGGTVYFDGGTAVYIQCNQAGDEIEFSQDFGCNDLYIRGERLFFSWQYRTSSANDSRYLSTGVNLSAGYHMEKSGYVTAFGWTFYTASYVGTATTVNANLIKNTTVSPPFVSGGSLQSAGSGRLSYQVSADWGVNAFAADDYLDVRYTHSTGFGSTGVLEAFAWMEVAYN